MAPRGSDDCAPFTVLFVCTGNICRSPVAERVARAFLDAALGAEAACIHLGSAGTRAVVGSGVHPDSAAVLAGLGGKPAGFAARQLTDDLALDADLVLALTRSHRRSVLQRAPRGLARTFTLLEAADLAVRVPLETEFAEASLAARCRSLVREMAAGRMRRASDARDDIPDPFGQPASVHQDVGQLIADATVRLFGRFTDLAADRPAWDRLIEGASAAMPTSR